MLPTGRCTSGAGLMTKSFRTLQAVDPGFDRDSVLTFDLALLSHAYPEQPQVVAIYLMGNLPTRYIMTEQPDGD